MTVDQTALVKQAIAKLDGEAQLSPHRDPARTEAIELLRQAERASVEDRLQTLVDDLRASRLGRDERMTAFTVIIRPDGKAIVACAERLPDADMEAARHWFGRWERDPANRPLFMGDTKVIQVTEIDVDLDSIVGNEPEGD